MPIYEYQCKKCGQFEVMQRITEPPLERCPQCRTKVKKLISNTSFQLKGSGWYATDYARRGSTAPEKAGDGKADGKADSSTSKSTGDAKSTDTKSGDIKSSDAKSSDATAA
jgi:putative FmdB family regulatory protein